MEKMEKKLLLLVRNEDLCALAQGNVQMCTRLLAVYNPTTFDDFLNREERSRLRIIQDCLYGLRDRAKKREYKKNVRAERDEKYLQIILEYYAEKKVDKVANLLCADINAYAAFKTKSALLFVEFPEEFIQTLGVLLASKEAYSSVSKKVAPFFLSCIEDVLSTIELEGCDILSIYHGLLELYKTANHSSAKERIKRDLVLIYTIALDKHSEGIVKEILKLYPSLKRVV